MIDRLAKFKSPLAEGARERFGIDFSGEAGRTELLEVKPRPRLVNLCFGCREGHGSRLSCSWVFDLNGRWPSSVALHEV